MTCIFCKLDSSGSHSVEHIIPESLGNTEHVLAAGIVCDRCNNYFSNHVEGPLLADPYFADQRFRASIKTKKGKAPRVQGLHLQSRVELELYRNLDSSGISVGAAHEKDEAVWVESLLKRSEAGSFLIPTPDAPSESLMSRFLAKLALECLARRLADVDGGISEIASKPELDPIRNYARRGYPKNWPFHCRRLYPADFAFAETGRSPYEVLHEWTLLYEDDQLLYLVVAIFGVEYAINLGEPEIATYAVWLKDNHHSSPLYPNGLLSG